jgi:trehalose 6-phosphate synthase/phosphatase
VEIKDFSVAWHYRMADPEQSQVLVGEVSDHLKAFTANIDVQVLHGAKVLEIKSAGVNKGMAVRYWLDAMPGGAVLAMGDDSTDEDIFHVVPDTAYSIKIGLTSTRARYTLPDTQEAITLLESLASA